MFVGLSVQPGGLMISVFFVIHILKILEITLYI